MDKIKKFFQSKITKTICWILICLEATILIVGGVTAENLSSGMVLVAGIVTAISALVAFISSQIKD